MGEVQKAQLLRTLGCMTETAQKAFRDLQSDAAILQQQVESLSEDEQYSTHE